MHDVQQWQPPLTKGHSLPFVNKFTYLQKGESVIRRKDPTEIEHIRASGQIVFSVQQKIEALIAPGISTRELDEIAETAIREAGARPAFKGYHDFPASICASVNASIVHGFPSDEPLVEGDIVSIDVGTELNGYYGDGAFTIGVGSISAAAAHLIATTQQCLNLGIEQMFADARLGDISHAIQTHAETAGYSIVREYGGHGIGRELHESPHINNYGHPGKGPRLKAGHVFCIEPILSMGNPEVEHEEDGWTVYTRDRSVTAHCEHTVAITENGPEILTLPSTISI
jgi:methionyl aminopeptidase